MGNVSLSTAPERWELAAEAIAIKMRWFGLLVGYVLANIGTVNDRAILNAILCLGAIYALLDTYYSFRGRVFLGRYPLAISVMEALFIGLLCFFHGGLDSFFRFYYFLSLICCAIRYPPRATFVTCALHSASYTALYLAQMPELRDSGRLVVTLVILWWVAWASAGLAVLLKRVGEHLQQLNLALQENQTMLEERIAERTRQLQEAQAHLLHQEKMAAFGLLAAGIAHEVGNPLASISSLVQMVQRRDCDDYSRDKLALVTGQLHRIQNTLRELINFSRPTSTERTQFAVRDVVEEALNIAKYYKDTSRRSIVAKVSADLPPLEGVHDHMVQVILNLVLNAVDATTKGGKIEVAAELIESQIVITVRDDGHGIEPHHEGRLFLPYFTTKKHGTGLGLFVTRKLVADHGGKVAYSSGPDGGTEFRIVLPAIASAGTPSLCAAGPAEETRS